MALAISLGTKFWKRTSDDAFLSDALFWGKVRISSLFLSAGLQPGPGQILAPPFRRHSQPQHVPVSCGTCEAGMRTCVPARS